MNLRFQWNQMKERMERHIFYDLSFTVHNGQAYTMPMTGGNGFPLLPLAVVLMALGGAIGICVKLKKWRSESRKSLDQQRRNYRVSECTAFVHR